MSVSVDKTMAIAIARRLLEQHFINEIDAVLGGNMWIVTGQVQLFNMRDVKNKDRCSHGGNTRAGVGIIPQNR